MLILQNYLGGQPLTIIYPKRPGEANPGATLKALRRAEKWTLADVAGKTGLPISTLSRLENGKMAMTYEKLLQICTGLGVDMNALIGSTAIQPQRIEGGFRRAIARAGDGPSVLTPTGNYLYVAAELLNKRVTPIVGDVKARSIDEYEEYLRHSGEEYLFVLNGTLDLYTEAYAPVRLEQGDSIYFDSSMGHAYVSASDVPCQVLSICAAAGGEVLEHHRLGSPIIRHPETGARDSAAPLALGSPRSDHPKKRRRAAPGSKV